MTNHDQQQATPKDIPFNPLRTPQSDVALKLSQAIREEIEANETRQRARKAKDQDTFTQQIDTLVANLTYRYLTEPEGWLAISLSKQKLSRADRYRLPAMSKTMSEVIKTMTTTGLVEFNRGFQSGFTEIANKQSTIKAGLALRRRIDTLGLTVGDLGYSTEGELIILKRAREDVFDHGGAIQYTDTPTTNAYREQVRRLNKWLAVADLDFDECLSETPVDVAHRRLRRIFNLASFEHGGRLFGGFWQDLSKRQRKRGLLINGNPVTTLDFGQIAPRIMYGMAQAPLHFEDAYLLPGLDNKHRDGVKKVFNAMLHAKERQKRFPHGTRDLIPNKAIKVDRVINAILEHHAPVAHLFYNDQGLRVMFDESQILIAIMEKLMDQNIICLPIHDALVVEEDHAPLVREIMISTFKEITGIEIPVDTDDE